LETTELMDGMKEIFLEVGLLLMQKKENMDTSIKALVNALF
jgi:hypothetical protein